MTRKIAVKKVGRPKKNILKYSRHESKESRIEKRLKAFHSLVGLWEGKDTSFFDKR